MNKKFYEAPEMESIIVNVANTLLAGSVEGSDDGSSDLGYEWD